MPVLLKGPSIPGVPPGLVHPLEPWADVGAFSNPVQVQVKVGSFVKMGTTGFQRVFGLGFRPKAILFWTSGDTVDGTIQTQATADARACLGFASGPATAEQYAVSTSAETEGGGGKRVTQKAILLNDVTGSLVAEASLYSWDSDAFTLNWTTNDGGSQIVNYMALGGRDIRARVITFDAIAATGTFPVTGVGFQPNLLLTAGSATQGLIDTGVVGTCGLRIGAGMSSASRWTVSCISAQAVSSAAYRWHRNDRFSEQPNTGGTSSNEMDLVSLDADGFTLNQTVFSTQVKMSVLCLKVPIAAMGTFTKPTGGGPATGTVSGLQFTPQVVLLASDQDINRANAISQTGARIGVSAFTATDAQSSVFSIPDTANPLTYSYLVKSAKAAVKIDNATPVIDAECTGVMNSDGFSLTWNANDAVATEYSYIALGSFPYSGGHFGFYERRDQTRLYAGRHYRGRRRRRRY